MEKRKPTSIVHQLRAAILASGKTKYRISQESGVTPATLNRFMNGQRDLKLESAAKLCQSLGLELRERSNG